VNLCSYLVNFTVSLTLRRVNFKVFPSKNRNRPSEHLRGHVTPPERTFGPFPAPEKRTFRLILLDLTKHPPRTQEMQIPFARIARKTHPRRPKLINSDLNRDLYETDVRRVWNERSVKDGVSTVLLFQVL
jgi:hypothetical protein